MDWLTMTNTTIGRSHASSLGSRAAVPRSAAGCSRARCAKRAPYFGTIKPRFLDLRAEAVPRHDEEAPRRRKSHRHRACARHGKSLRARRRHVHRSHHPGRHALDSARHDHRIPRQGRDATSSPPRGSTRPSGPARRTSACRSPSPTPNGKEVVRAVISMYVSPKREIPG